MIMFLLVRLELHCSGQLGGDSTFFPVVLMCKERYTNDLFCFTFLLCICVRRSIKKFRPLLNALKRESGG